MFMDNAGSYYQFRNYFNLKDDITVWWCHYPKNGTGYANKTTHFNKEKSHMSGMVSQITRQLLRFSYSLMGQRKKDVTAMR